MHFNLLDIQSISSSLDAVLSWKVIIINYNFVLSSLKRLVHAMILKRPPGEWLGIIRSAAFVMYLFLCRALFYF